MNVLLNITWVQYKNVQYILAVGAWKEPDTLSLIVKLPFKLSERTVKRTGIDNSKMLAEGVTLEEIKKSIESFVNESDTLIVYSYRDKYALRDMVGCSIPKKVEVIQQLAKKIDMWPFDNISLGNLADLAGVAWCGAICPDMYCFYEKEAYRYILERMCNHKEAFLYIKKVNESDIQVALIIMSQDGKTIYDEYYNVVNGMADTYNNKESILDRIYRRCGRCTVAFCNEEAAKCFEGEKNIFKIIKAGDNACTAMQNAYVLYAAYSK